MGRWYRTISSEQDIIDFRDHLLKEMKRNKYLEDRYYPESIIVSGAAYKPMKAEIEIFLKRNTITSWPKAIIRIFSMLNSDGRSEWTRLLGDFANDYYRLKDKPFMKAAKRIADIGYYNVGTDSGGRMQVYYHKMLAMDEPFVNMPNLY